MTIKINRDAKLERKKQKKGPLYHDDIIPRVIRKMRRLKYRLFFYEETMALTTMRFEPRI